MTRDTVIGETPARRATSWIVTAVPLRRPDFTSFAMSFRFVPPESPWQVQKVPPKSCSYAHPTLVCGSSGSPYLLRDERGTTSRYNASHTALTADASIETRVSSDKKIGSVATRVKQRSRIGNK